MIEERAVVVASDNDFVEVEAQRRSACHACNAKAACGTSLLGRFLGRRPLRVRVYNSIGAAIGEEVVIGIPEPALLRTASSAYLAPLVGLLLGAVCGEQLASSFRPFSAELLSVAGGLLGFALALRWSRSYAARIASDPRFRPMLMRRQAPGKIEQFG